MRSFRLTFLSMCMALAMILASGKVQAQGPQCAQVHSNSREGGKAPALRNEHGQIRDKARYFKDIAWLMNAMMPEIHRELSLINNQLGSEIEIRQTKAFLRKVELYEMQYLNGIQPVENTVIYGSTNVPLYTLITQVFLTGTFSQNVWFRTPKATRDVYLKIFKIFEDHLPREYTQNIHLITDPSELAYDQFNRVYVMGQNRAGTKSVRPPSELVILTGNPDTARTMIDRNIRNLKKLAKEFPGRKQLFLGFLAGVNPAVVVPSARENMASVVDKITFPFLVNGGQDCMNSDLVFVHQSVSNEFSTSLLAKMKSFKFTTNLDIDRGLTPLTMTKGFDKLVEYREKYKKYLLNPDATLNPETKQVSPHIFAIPFSEFSKLDIQEHFAPFVTLVTFENFNQLTTASLDTRLQRKAMAALIYGSERMAPDVDQARNIFRQAQHFVLLNTHLYQEFEMNMPFGGTGSDTSISTLVQLRENGEITVENRNRPLLISKETETAFQKEGVYQTAPADPPTALPKTYYPSSARVEESSQESLLRAGRQDGVVILGKRQMSPAMLKNAEELYGVKFAFPSNGPTRRVKGVVLHTAEVIDEPSNRTSLLGDRNPLLGEEAVLKIVQQNKMEEMKLAQSVDPRVMPGVRTHDAFFSETEKNEFKVRRDQILRLMDDLKSDLSPSAKTRLENVLYVFVKDFLTAVQRKSPRGAYVKNYGEYASGDLGSTVTSFSASPLQITKEFLLWYFQAQNRSVDKSLRDTDVQEFLQDQKFSNFTRFLKQLLTDPSPLLIQQKVELAQTQQGTTMEFRVDFFNGRAVSSRMRFGLEHYPREMQKAKEVVDAFFAQSPEAIKKLSGGADVALTKDGRWIIFEFNFGGASGTLYAEYYPFEANAIFSYLMGKNTPLLRTLKSWKSKTPTEINAFLKKLKNEKPVWWKFAISEISQIEWAKAIRDEMLNDWMKIQDPAEKSRQAEEILNGLRVMVDGLGTHGNLDFQRLLETADEFLAREQRPQ